VFAVLLNNWCRFVVDSDTVSNSIRTFTLIISHFSVGTSMGDTTIQNYVIIKTDQKNATKLFTSIPQEKVYATVKCTTGAG
jgi:hypothetical protein